jgi:hypothetical protein
MYLDDDLPYTFTDPGTVAVTLRKSIQEQAAFKTHFSLFKLRKTGWSNFLLPLTEKYFGLKGRCITFES